MFAAVLQNEQWLHDVEHITADNVGNIYWKGRPVEHYDNPDDPKWRESLMELTKCCQHIESLGLVPGTVNVVWRWRMFKDLSRENPYFDLIANGFYIVLVKGDETLFIIDQDIASIAVVVVNDEGVHAQFHEEQWEADIFRSCHDAGWEVPDVGQAAHTSVTFGKCDPLTALFQQRRIPADLHQQVAAQRR